MSQPTQTDRANWRSVKEQVKFYVSIGAFNAYFRNSELIDIEGNQLTVAVGHDYAVDWLTNRLPKIVNEACLYIWGREMAVSFVVRQPESTQLTFIQEVNQQDANTPLTDAKPSFSWGGFEGLKTNFTQVPNEFIQNVIPYVSSSVAILVLMTFRYTIGQFIDMAGNREEEWVTTRRGIELACNISRSSAYTAIWDARAQGLLVYRLIEDDVERKHLCRRQNLTVEKRQEVFTLRPRWSGEDIDYPETPRHGR